MVGSLLSSLVHSRTHARQTRLYRVLFYLGRLYSVLGTLRRHTTRISLCLEMERALAPACVSCLGAFLQGNWGIAALGFRCLGYRLAAEL